MGRGVYRPDGPPLNTPMTYAAKPYREHNLCPYRPRNSKILKRTRKGKTSMTRTSKLTTLGLLATLAASAMTPALADRASDQKNKNNTRNLAILGAAIGGYGLLSHNNTIALLGAAGAGLAGNQYEKDRKNQSQDSNHRYYYRDGYQYNNRNDNRNDNRNNNRDDNRYNDNRYNDNRNDNRYSDNQYNDTRNNGWSDNRNQSYNRDNNRNNQNWNDNSNQTWQNGNRTGWHR